MTDPRQMPPVLPSQSATPVSANDLPNIQIPAHLEVLQGPKTAYRFSLIQGHVVSQPEINDEYIEFFVQDSTTGKDHLMRFATKLNARFGQPVSFLQATDEKTGTVIPVAWCNHALDQMEYFKQTVKALAGGKAAKLFAAMTGASIASMTETSGRHGGFVNLLLLPIWLIILGLSAATGMIAMLLGRQNRLPADDILEHASHIFQEGTTLSIPTYVRGKSYWKWVFIAVAVFLLLPVITLPFQIAAAFLFQ